jgi:hypothetical protein
LIRCVDAEHLGFYAPAAQFGGQFLQAFGPPRRYGDIIAGIGKAAPRRCAKAGANNHDGFFSHRGSFPWSPKS